MDILSNVLPIIIYFLLIIFIVIGIVLGIKTIITIDKVNKVADDINEKLNQISPIFDTIGVISNKFNSIVEKVVSTCETLFGNLFLNHRKHKKERENKENE